MLLLRQSHSPSCQNADDTAGPSEQRNTVPDMPLEVLARQESTLLDSTSTRPIALTPFEGLRLRVCLTTIFDVRHVNFLDVVVAVHGQTSD